MRRTLGWLFFIVGIIVLGWWAKNHQAVNIQNEVSEGADATTGDVNAEYAEANVIAEVSGRDITLSGSIPEADQGAIHEAYQNVTGERVVRDQNVAVMPLRKPYTLSATKDEAGVTVKGYTNSKPAAQAIEGALPDLTANVELASGAPAGWTDTALAGINALDQMESGQLTMSDNTISLTGMASDKASRQNILGAMQGNISGEFTSNMDIDAPLEGPDFIAEFDIQQGMNLVGDSTEDGSADRLGELFNAPIASNEMTMDAPGSITPIADRLTGIGNFLPSLNTAKVTVEEDRIDVTGQVAAGGDPEAIGVEMATILGDDDQLNITLDETVNNGDKRSNALNGQTEVYTNGYWLPTLSQDANVQICQSKTDEILKEKIEFVIGSAQIDASGERMINALAGTLYACLANGNLTLEIGGHTDNLGNPESNRALSEARARAVAQAITERGVSLEDIKIVGYGDTQPIADNANASGRATNRRTTIIWIEK